MPALAKVGHFDECWCVCVCVREKENRIVKIEWMVNDDDYDVEKDDKQQQLLVLLRQSQRRPHNPIY